MDVRERRRQIIASQPHKASAAGETFEIKVGEPKIEKLLVNFSPVQTGSGTPSPTNVRPISGWTVIPALVGVGKNLFDFAHADVANKKIRNDSGVEVSDNGGSYTMLYTPVKPSTTYTISAFTATNSKRVYFYDSARTWISRTASTLAKQMTFTTPSNCYFVQFQSGSYQTQEQWNCQLEEGSTATSFEPYHGVTATANLGGTYYGGTVDLVSGTMTVTHGLETRTWGSMTNRATWTNCEMRTASSTFTFKSPTSICNVAPYIYKFEQDEPHAYVNNGSWNLLCALPIGASSDTVVQWAFELETPQVITLTPQTISAIRGQQTVLTPADSIEIDYWAHDNTVRQLSYGGIPVFTDNAYFATGVGRLRPTAVTYDPDWFIAGYFDSGTTDAKSLTWKKVKRPGHDAAMMIYTDRDADAIAADWWPTATGTSDADMTYNVKGRYVLFSVYKPRAGEFYMKNNATSQYIFKGNDVT